MLQPVSQVTVHVDRFLTVIVDGSDVEVSADAASAPADAAPAAEPTVDAVAASGAEIPANAAPQLLAPAEPHSTATSAPRAEEAREIVRIPSAKTSARAQYHAPDRQYQPDPATSTDVRAPTTPVRVHKPLPRSRERADHPVAESPEAVSNDEPNCAEDDAVNSSICPVDSAWNPGWNCRWIPDCIRVGAGDFPVAASEEPNDVVTAECEVEDDEEPQYQPPSGQYQPAPINLAACADEPDAGVAMPGVLPVQPGAHGLAGREPTTPASDVAPSDVAPIDQPEVAEPLEPTITVTRFTKVQTSVEVELEAPVVLRPAPSPAAPAARPRVSRLPARASAPPVVRRPEPTPEVTVVASGDRASAARHSELDLFRLLGFVLGLSGLGLIASALAGTIYRAAPVANLAARLRSRGLSPGETKSRGIRYRDP